MVSPFVPCPPTRWIDAESTLSDFAIVTFAVDPARLAAHLALETETVNRMD
jgi:hypothetical protein